MKLKVPSGHVVEFNEPADLLLIIAQHEATMEKVREDIRFLKKRAKQLGEWPIVPGDEQTEQPTIQPKK